MPMRLPVVVTMRMVMLLCLRRRTSLLRRRQVAAGRGERALHHLNGDVRDLKQLVHVLGNVFQQGIIRVALWHHQHGGHCDL